MCFPHSDHGGNGGCTSSESNNPPMVLTRVLQWHTQLFRHLMPCLSDASYDQWPRAVAPTPDLIHTTWNTLQLSYATLDATIIHGYCPAASLLQDFILVLKQNLLYHPEALAYVTVANSCRHALTVIQCLRRHMTILTATKNCLLQWVRMPEGILMWGVNEWGGATAPREMYRLCNLQM